jgi:Ca2+-binding RTX toxin-like protein
MADFVGGPESNVFEGTEGNDSFTPGTGGGVVNGLGGIDTLSLSYAGFNAGAGAFGRLTYSFYESTPRGFYVVNGSVFQRTDIYTIETLNFVGGSYEESVEITYFSTLDIGLNLDGGAGAVNALVLDYFYDETVSFVVSGGTITTNMGIFARFGAFDLGTGGGNDTIAIDSWAMTINTRSGNDTVTLTGSNGSQIFTGDGADIIHAGSGDDQIAPDGVDPVVSLPDAYADFVDAGAGNDVVMVGPNDTAIGGAGNDTLHLFLQLSTVGVNIDLGLLLAGGTVQNGTGTISGFEVMGSLNLGSGNDTVVLGDAPNAQWTNALAGNGGDDTLTGGAANNSLLGGNGDDALYGLAGNDSMSGGLGNDFLDGGDGNDQLYGDDDPIQTGADEILGGAGDDHIESFGGNDILDGGIGNDTILAWGGDDQIEGGAGDDYINGGGDFDTVNGGDGNDTILAGGQFATPGAGQHDNINGGAGNDTVTLNAAANGDGGTGTDRLSLDYSFIGSGVTVNLQDILAGVAGANAGGTAIAFESVHAVVGTPHADTIVFGTVALTDDGFGNPGGVYAGAGDDHVTGGSGNDSLNGQVGNDSLFGGAGNDSFDASEGNDLLFGGTGNDTYTIDSMADLTFELTGEGTDTVKTFASVYLYANIDNLVMLGGGGGFGVGNELDNVMTGNIGDNLLLGAAGHDTITGDQGNDLLYGEAGNDSLSGDYGIDYLAGGLGNDVLDGGVLEDALYGEDGDDILWGGDQFFTDILVGGAGHDTLHGDSGATDYDLMDGGSGDDTYWVDTGADLTFESVDGGIDTVHADIPEVNGGVYLYANVENLVLEGTTGFGVGNELANQLTGSASGNWLLGGSGNDRINGKGGNDVLFGQAGADTFVFGAGSGQDVIGDFSIAEDKIEFGTTFTSFAQVQANMVQNGANMAINLGGGNFIVLQGINKANLTAANFTFALAAEAPKASAPLAFDLHDAFIAGRFDDWQADLHMLSLA